MRPRRIEPGPGQESVWDYPRPPRVEEVSQRLRVVLGGRTVADTQGCAEAAYRVLETSHPPTYYLPLSSFMPGSLRRAAGSSFCEWKGRAVYADIVAGDVVAPEAAWGYPEPARPYAVLRDRVAVYPGRVQACLVDDERVEAQPGGFYGGWMTSRIAGPVKGEPGTTGW